MEDSIPDRYAKNPMLAIVENYVLDAIGKLDPSSAAKLNQIVCRTFGGTDWRKIIQDQFNLPPETSSNLQQMWNQRIEESLASQTDLTPEDFARQVVDEMFKGLGA